MDIYHYNCQYCGREYKPNRRRVQKYCCTSCKNNSYNLKKKNDLIIISEKKCETNKPIQIEKMSISGVGNAAVGTLAVNALTSLFTSEENKPATRKDIRNLTNSLKQRFHPVLNIPVRYDGAKPFYDLETKIVVYRSVLK